MRRRDFLKISGSFAGMKLFAFRSRPAAAGDNFDRSGVTTANTTSQSAFTSRLTVLGAGGFGCRIASLLPYEASSLRIRQDALLSFIAADTCLDQAAVAGVPELRSVTADSACAEPFPLPLAGGDAKGRSLVILIAGLGGATGARAIERYSRQAAVVGAKSIAVLAMPVDDMAQREKATSQLDAIKRAADITFVIDESPDLAFESFSQRLACIGKSHFQTESRIRNCVLGLIRTSLSLCPYSLSHEEICSFLLSSKTAGYGASHRNHADAPMFAAWEAANGAAPFEPGMKLANVSSALVAFSGNDDDLMWKNIKPAREGIRRMLGDTVPCRFVLNREAIPLQNTLRTEVWLAVS